MARFEWPDLGPQFDQQRAQFGIVDPRIVLPQGAGLGFGQNQAQLVAAGPPERGRQQHRLVLQAPGLHDCQNVQSFRHVRTAETTLHPHLVTL